MSHHGMPSGSTTEPTTRAARKSKRIRFGPGRVLTPSIAPQGNVTHLDKDKTITKPRGNLNRMKYVDNSQQPLTPQELRRRKKKAIAEKNT